MLLGESILLFTIPVYLCRLVQLVHLQPPVKAVIVLLF